MLDVPGRSANWMRDAIGALPASATRTVRFLGSITCFRRDGEGALPCLTVGVNAPTVSDPAKEIDVAPDTEIRPGAEWKPPDPRRLHRRHATTPPTASPRSRSAGPRCATRSGPARCSSCATRSRSRATIPTIGVIILTGEGPEAFCSGGDQRVRGDDGYRDDHGIGRLNVLDLQVQIRRLPKPVIAMVAGYAIGGGHVLHVVCDLTIAADNARFGQTGPRVGIVRRRLRLRAARAHRRPEEGARDLVPVRAVRRAGRARHGPRQQGRAARRPRGRDGRVGAHACCSTRRSRCAC